MAWRCIGYKPLYTPMITEFYDTTSRQKFQISCILVHNDEVDDPHFWSECVATLHGNGKCQERNCTHVIFLSW